MVKKEEIKALILLSGGLDSILAAKLLLKAEIKVEAFTFQSPFLSVEKAKIAAKKLGISIYVYKMGREYLKILKNPKYGYGKGFNPCIDCHIFMYKKAFKYALKNNFHFIATGEVLGERPMSQNRQALEIVSKKSGANGYLLRPLSAKLLPSTIPEKEGWFKRENLLDIQGRSRKRQIALANKLGILKFPTPAGGCLLTDTSYSQRLKTLFEKWPDFDFSDAEIIKYGRNFWEDKNLILVGRHHEDNLKLLRFYKASDTLMKVKEKKGPITLIRTKEKNKKNKALKKAGLLTLRYAHLETGTLLYGYGEKFDQEIST